MEYFIHNGPEPQAFTLPTGWTPLISSHFSEENKVTYRSVANLTEEALRRPIDSHGLLSKIPRASKVAILTDDGTRPTPVHEILPGLLDVLFQRGLGPENLDIVVALGTHAPMGKEALSEKIGEGVSKTYRVTQHDCRAEDLVPVGHLRTGAEVRINQKVARADIRIGIGSIFPHPMNGYGGGPKIIFPGVSNYDAVREHHLTWTVHPKSIFGNIEGNPFYQEIFRVASMAKLTYSLNCVFDTQDRVTALLFGSFENVHEQGIALSKQLCGTEISAKSDITLLSAYPYMEPFQIIKPLIIGSLVTKPGGTVILVAKARARMPSAFAQLVDRIHHESHGRLREYAIGKFRSNQLLLEGEAIDFNCALFFTVLCRESHRLVVVSRDLGDEEMERMGFVHYESLEAAIEAESHHHPNATVNVLPLGGTTLPILSEELSMSY